MTAPVLEKSAAARCMKCGFCMSSCPVYQADHMEFHVARGRNMLIRMADAGEIADEDAYGKCLEHCLLCGRCQTVCPAKVPSPEINVQARQKRFAFRGASLPQKLIFKGILQHRPWMANLIGIAGLIPGLNQPIGRPIRHMADVAALFSGGIHIPRIARPFLSKQLGSLMSPPKGVPLKGRIAYFPGCGFEFFFSQSGVNTARALAAAGFEVVIAKELTCCGMAVYNAGDVDTARLMAARNIAALAAFDHIVTGCATCGSTLKKYGQWFEGDAEMEAKARGVSEKVSDFSQFLVNQDFRATRKFAPAIKVTYHEPCHLKWHQGVGDYPRKLLRQLTGVGFVEMESADACCGLGGSFGIKHRQASLAIQAKKMASIRKTGAQIVATACPGCMVQLMDGARRHGVDVDVMHVSELIVSGR